MAISLEGDKEAAAFGFRPFFFRRCNVSISFTCKGGRFQSIFFGSGSGSVLAKFRFSVLGSGSVLLCSKAKT